MFRVAVYALSELRQDAQFRLVAAVMNVKALQIVWRALPPIIGVIRDVIPVTDDRALPVLDAGRAVEIVAIKPGPRSVEHFARPQLVLPGSSRDRMMKFQIGGHSG